MKTCQILFAGFGGQGILFAGKFLAYKGLLAGKQVSWLPSYGPEMRGGTANCSVIVSDAPIGSPIVDRPDVLVVMNAPSLDKYEDAVVPGGKIFVDSAMNLANDHEISTLANMIMTGKVMQEVAALGAGNVDAALHKVVSARHQDLLELNKKALLLGAQA